MKKMIKNLMLVAVAAMAFVACSQEGNEVTILTKKTTIDFIASFDAETRSHFVESTDGATFKSLWNGGEEVLLFADAGNSIYADGTATMVLPEGGDGTTATFTGEFNGSVPSAGIIKAYVPASAWNVWSEAITIPATQTPTDHSVDSAAHILFGQTDYTDITTLDSAEIMFSHAVAYGKMTIADAFESIDEVTITIDETEKYTINTNELTSSTIWFACYANENVNNLEVLVKSGDKSYVRTYNLSDGKLAFKTGRVSIFSVSNFEEYVAPAFTSETTYFYTDGNYNDILLIFSSTELGTLQLNFYGAFDGNYITPGTYKLGDVIYIGNGTDYSYYNPAGTSYKLNSGSVVVSITEDKKYHFEFVNILYNENTGTLNTSYTGDIESFTTTIDTRTKLDTPAVEIPVANGKEITLKWSAVKGADGYYVYCSQDNTINTTTTELTATFTMPAYSTTYNFYIKAIANEDNADYRDSDETYFQTAETGKDPNKLADYVMDSLEWNSNVYYKGGAFQMKGSVLPYPNNDYVAFYLNSADHTENSIKPGVYESYSDYTPASGQFAGLLSLNWGTFTKPTSFDSTCSLTVEFADNVYTVILNYKGITYGYKGMPSGWVAPEFSDNDNTGGEDGGDEPETPTDGVGSSIDNPYIYTSCVYTTSSGYYKYIFTGDGVYQLNLESNLQSPATSFPAIATDSKFGNAENEYYFAGTTYTGGPLDSDKTEITTEDLGGGIYRFSLKLVLQDGNIHYAKYEGTISSL